MVIQVNRKDIQGIVASGYDHLDYARFVFLEIVDSEAAKTWLSDIIDLITTAEHPGDNKHNYCVNLAISWEGLQAMGLSGVIRDFPHEFVHGMNRGDAGLILGDVGGSGHQYWDYGADPANPLHLLLLLYGKTAHVLQSLYDLLLRTNALRNGLQIVAVQDTSREPGDFTEHFGFRDGISQPPVQGLVGRKGQSEHPIKTGEFVLGYENELRSLTRIPSVNNWDDPYGYLADHPRNCGRRRGFGLNGTYLVFRKLIQRVDDFNAYIDKMSIDENNRVNERARELLAAKMIGRWKSGSPLVLTPESPGIEPRNDFLFMTLDPDGRRCPIGSHIRRANPRDSLNMPPSRSITISRRHRIIRRGRKFAESAKCSLPKHGKLDKGVYFIALNADLRRQFEFIQQLWINDPNFNGLDYDRDPIAGDNSNGGEFTIQSKPFNKHFKGLSRFVTVRGGGYFFVPGIRAIRFVASHQRQPNRAPTNRNNQRKKALGEDLVLLHDQMQETHTLLLCGFALIVGAVFGYRSMCR